MSLRAHATAVLLVGALSLASTTDAGSATKSTVKSTAKTTARSSIVKRRAPGAKPRPTTKPVVKTSADSKLANEKVFAVDASHLAEVSGCAVSRKDPSKVWVHNDSGKRVEVVVVDLSTGVVGSPTFFAANGRPIENYDVEDVASTSDGRLVLGDIGDNTTSRASVHVVVAPEPTPGDASTTVTNSIRATYPDGARDAEALAVTPDNSEAWIIAKDASKGANVYRLSLSGSAEQVLTSIGSIAISSESFFFANLITAADFVPGPTPTLAVRTYQRGYLLRSGTSDPAGVLKAKPVPFDLPLMLQAEALCASPDGAQLVTASESLGSKTFQLAVVPTPR